MTISSTQFQQKVGYYLNLADKGETIVIEKLKPAGKTFVLKKGSTKKQDSEKDRIKDLMKFIKENTVKSSTGESGLEFQRRVRS